MYRYVFGCKIVPVNEIFSFKYNIYFVEIPHNNNTVKDLEDEKETQVTQICKLNKKLLNCDQLEAKRNNLEIKLYDLRGWAEGLAQKDNRMNIELETDYDKRKKLLQQSIDIKTELQDENCKLKNCYEVINEHLNEVNISEKRCLIELDELEITKNRQTNDLSCSKVSYIISKIISYDTLLC